MPCVYKCCFWFSLRLGNILIAIFSSLKSLLVIVLLLETGKERLWTLLKNMSNQLEFNNQNTNYVTKEFNRIYVFLIVFYAGNSITSIMLGFGAYLCSRCLCFPFIIYQIAYFILGFYPFTIFFRYLTYLAFESEDEAHRAKLNLPSVIAITTVVYLYVALILYITACAYSFTEVVRILKEEVEAEKSASVVLKPKFDGQFYSNRTFRY